MDDDNGWARPWCSHHQHRSPRVRSRLAKKGSESASPEHDTHREYLSSAKVVTPPLPPYRRHRGPGQILKNVDKKITMTTPSAEYADGG